MTDRKTVTSLLLGISTIAMGMAAPAAAQTTPAEATATATGGGLEEIIVTARRREEALQDTPISVSALSSATLERSNVQALDDITRLMPNVAIQAQSGFLAGNTAFIRGIGSQEPLLSVDSPVGIYIDGVYIGRNNASNLELVDLERIEVLRGPQGTLFGRNTTGGAISMVTKKPAAEFGIEQKIQIAEYDEYASRTRIDTGLLGDSGVSATLSYMHRQRDGYLNNKYADGSHSQGALNTDAIWAKVNGEWGSFSAAYTFDWTDMRGVPGGFQTRFLSPLLQSYYANTTGNSLLDEVQQDYNKNFSVRSKALQRVKIIGHALTLQYDVNDAITLKSITGRRTYKAALGTAYAPPGIFGNTTTGIKEVQIYSADAKDEDVKQFSEEFQLLARFGDFSWVGGLYYFKEDSKYFNPTSYSFVLSPTLASNLSSSTIFDYQAKSYAAFGQGSWKPQALDEKLELTLGVRYTKDKKAVQQTASTVRNGKASFDDTSVNAIISYKPVDDVMVYARYGTGYRSGGFNTRASATQSFVFEPEKAKTYEAGIKSEFLDRHVRLNAAVFHTDYKDLQVTQYLATAAGGGGFTNNASAKFRGFEVEMQAVPVNGLTLDASVGYVDPKYNEIFFIVPATPVPGHTPGPGEVPGGLGNYADISKFPYVPNWTVHLGGQYLSEDIGFGKLLLKLDYSHTSKRYFMTNILNGLNFANAIADPGQHQIDARIGLVEIPVGGKTMDLSIFAENLTNEHNITAGIDFGALGFAGNIYNQPRRIGVDAKIAF
ncbi:MULTISPECIES: TonB-dependent receptor [unclassified Sphingomonas]|uniref:TonB-dependent receptor n=1 Tax=unclassified Sphingomonas TaxID=196159 RepID=UPI0006FCA94F|nr:MULTISPECIES: TonB-dependent receptor [unclassified Sphingomonas]KQX18184.1 ligand-gated channel protein [Sphingomonas sp. Root1294]KQY70989.1 ligand-gated channel protein [Sphingomonas sp. Root50]KRB91943.1 ligand-gated channel protein [Sphingomonas sp. Root720]